MVDVKLNYSDEWGVLDAYYFHQFLKTTLELKEIADLFVDSNHDTAQAFAILQEKGLLQFVADRSGKQKGYVAQA